MQVVEQRFAHALPEVTHGLVPHEDEPERMAPAQRLPERMRADRLPGAADQAQPALQGALIDGAGDAAATIGGRVFRMGRPHEFLGATVQLDQAVEYRVAGQAAAPDIFHINVVFAIRFAAMEHQIGEPGFHRRQAVQRIAARAHATLERIELGIENVGGVLDVDTQLQRCPAPEREPRHGRQDQAGHGPSHQPLNKLSGLRRAQTRALFSQSARWTFRPANIP